MFSILKTLHHFLNAEFYLLLFYFVFLGYHRLAKHLAAADDCYSSLFVDQFWRNFGEQPSKREEGLSVIFSAFNG